MLNYRTYHLLLLAFLVNASKNLCAQKMPPAGMDTNFYQTYWDMVTARVYMSQKYTTFTMNAPSDLSTDLHYRPNTTLNLGAGFTYRWLTLNLGYGFGFLNKDTEKGKTTYLDLQSHIYGRKTSIDLLGQFYNGMYLSPQGVGTTSSGNWYLRADMKVTHLGVVAYRVLNWKRFSYAAALVQNAWQKKSAGSFLIGLELYYGVTKADSAFVPSTVQNNYKQQGISKILYASAGPGVGYAYTLVIARNFYIMASVTSSLSLTFLKEWHKTGVANSQRISPGFAIRGGTGYNSTRLNISVVAVNNSIHLEGYGPYVMRTGNIRFNIAYRFAASAKLQKTWKHVMPGKVSSPGLGGARDVASAGF